MPDAHYYRGLALQAVPQLLEAELALITPTEVVAKLTDDPRIPLPRGVRRLDQHHVGWAINELVRRGTVERLTRTSKGARTVHLIVPAQQRLRTRAIEDAVKRKSALQARYLGWASGTPNQPGVLGPAAEAVVHRALLASGAVGYTVLNPQTGQTTVLRGAPVPGGALDNAAIFVGLDRQTNTPTGVFDVLVEVKNVRPWLYPGDRELHQLLWKAASLQHALPDASILPVLVCREAAHVTMTLTRTLGVYVVRTKRQLAPESLDESRLLEITEELGYRLDRDDQPAPALIKHFTTHIPGAATELAARWRTVGHVHVAIYEQLRRDDLTVKRRADLRVELLEAAGVTDHGMLDEADWYDG